MITDDKTVTLCIRIINILLKLSEWVNCLPSVGHRIICSCHRELCINSVTSPFLGTRGRDGSMRAGQLRRPLPPQGSRSGLTSGDPTTGSVMWFPPKTSPQSPAEYFLKANYLSAWVWKMVSVLRLAFGSITVLFWTPSPLDKHSISSLCSFTFLLSLLTTESCVPPYKGTAGRGIASLACGKGIKGAACVTCGGKK